MRVEYELYLELQRTPRWATYMYGVLSRTGVYPSNVEVVSCAWGAAATREHNGEDFLDAYDEEMQSRWGVSGRAFLAEVERIYGEAKQG